MVKLAARNEVPAIYEFREYVEAGGLASYGACITDGYRQAGVYAAQTLSESSKVRSRPTCRSCSRLSFGNRPEGRKGAQSQAVTLASSDR